MSRLFALGHVIEDGAIKPDPDRLRPLQELPLQINGKELKRVIGMFSYYSQYIPKFSDKILSLTNSSTFPLSSDAERAFNDFKREIEQSVVHAVDESMPFEIETDASDEAVAAVLNQGGRPVAFLS